MGVEGVREAIFLSASVPDPKRAPGYAETADNVAISAAVTALVYVTLGRRVLIWGGHPAITPMIWAVARTMDIEYGQWVRLYQSRWFEEQFPEDNKRFQNVTFTDVVGGDRDKSLRHMRERMFKEHQFDAGVFIGGMGGIVEEFGLFTSLQPEANPVPVVSTGGAVLDLERHIEPFPADLRNDLDYISLFHRHLHIAPQELRYSQPAKQPSKVADRMWSDENKRRPSE
jgi:SLOG cluster3 family